MPTTTNYGWTTPADTDLVKDGAAAIRTLGNSVDTTTKNLNPETTLGDIAYRSATANVNTRLALGSAHQVLRVNSAGNAPEWATTADQTPLTTKGDLFGFDTADARIPIGANGHILTADSTQSLGLKWAAPAGSSFVGCFGYLQTTMTIANNTDTFVTWDAESIDTDGFHSTTTNTDRFTVPAGKAGKYLFSGTVQFQGNSTGSRTIAVAKNGATGGSRLAIFEEAPGNTTQINLNWFLVVNAAVADYFGVYVAQTSGGNLSLYGNASNTMASTFAFVYLGA